MHAAPLARRPKLLDLFCGAGGAAMGYHRAGFDVYGVDIAPQPRYPFRFRRADALTVLSTEGHRFDAVHASPPCQRYSDLAKRNGNGDDWPDLIGPARDALTALGKPWVIENVEGAPLIDPVWLCGCQFPGLRVLRKRGFESNAHIPTLTCRPHPLVFTHDRRKVHYGQLDQGTAFVQVTGGGNCTVVNARVAMGIPWMTKGELNEAIPPAYTEYVGRFLHAAVAAEGSAGGATLTYPLAGDVR
jgi:DNA (cytosine-5)-methyltransferase 1